MSLIHASLIFGAAFAAGTINSIAGGGTLITFPILVWLGLDPKAANGTSTVALWPGLIGGFWGFRDQIAVGRPLLLRLGLTSVLGGGIGALALIATPTEIFSRLVPFLILFATLLFMAQEPITGWLGNRGFKHGRGWWAGVMLFQFASAVYGGYFGAGNGILMLAALGLLGLSDIHQANGIKNFLGVCINSVAVVCFALSGLVHWPDALLMAVAAIIGGYFGARTAKRLGRQFVRRAIALTGLTIGIVMLFRQIQD